MSNDTLLIDPANPPKCELCGEPMPLGEEMFKFHGYSGPCPKPPTAKAVTSSEEWDAEDIAELHRMIPDLMSVLSHNPVTAVYFRAGLLACREMMARFVEQGGTDHDKAIAQSIRANWWPSLGDDPGPPRQLDYNEIADERPDGSIKHKDMSPSVEALPRAWAFIVNPPAPLPSDAGERATGDAKDGGE